MVQLRVGKDLLLGIKRKDIDHLLSGGIVIVPLFGTGLVDLKVRLFFQETDALLVAEIKQMLPGEYITDMMDLRKPEDQSPIE